MTEVTVGSGAELMTPRSGQGSQASALPPKFIAGAQFAGRLDDALAVPDCVGHVAGPPVAAGARACAWRRWDVAEAQSLPGPEQLRRLGTSMRIMAVFQDTTWRATRSWSWNVPSLKTHRGCTRSIGIRRWTGFGATGNSHACAHACSGTRHVRKSNDDVAVASAQAEPSSGRPPGRNGTGSANSSSFPLMIDFRA